MNGVAGADVVKTGRIPGELGEESDEGCIRTGGAFLRID